MRGFFTYMAISVTVRGSFASSCSTMMSEENGASANDEELIGASGNMLDRPAMPSAPWNSVLFLPVGWPFPIGTALSIPCSHVHTYTFRFVISDIQLATLFSQCHVIPIRYVIWLSMPYH
jgi:hypothetical protein